MVDITDILSLDSVQLVQITPIVLWFMVPVTIVHGDFLNKLLTGGHHPVPHSPWDVPIKTDQPLG